MLYTTINQTYQKQLVSITICFMLKVGICFLAVVNEAYQVKAYTIGDSYNSWNISVGISLEYLWNISPSPVGFRVVSF